MMGMENKSTLIEADKERILELGGPAKVAEILGYSKESGGVQRVHNWMSRGIPAQIKLDYPDLFPREPTASRTLIPVPDIPNGAKAREAKGPLGRSPADPKKLT